MFDLSFAEIVVIAVVALVVLGPERLPKAARFAGLWVRRARSQWQSVRSELERELAAEELKRNIDQARGSVRGFDESARQEATRLRDDLQGTVAGTPSGPSPSEPPPPAGDEPAAPPSAPAEAAVTPSDQSAAPADEPRR